MRSIDQHIPLDAEGTASQEQALSERQAWLTPLVFIGLPLLLGAVGFAGYIALAIVLEVQPTETQPVFSHGQQAILISLPICTLISVSIGISLAFLVVRQRLIAAFLFSLIAIVGYVVTCSLWNAQIAQYGRDPSEIVLYHPPIGYSAVSAILAVTVTVLVLYGSIRRRNIA